jgi:YHS domain-containing protein
VEQKDIAVRGVEKPVPTSSLGLATVGMMSLRDPICGIPLSDTTAEATADDGDAGTVLFCSPGCLDTWQRRPTKASGVADPGGYQPESATG